MDIWMKLAPFFTFSESYGNFMDTRQDSREIRNETVLKTSFDTERNRPQWSSLYGKKHDLTVKQVFYQHI